MTVIIIGGVAAGASAAARLRRLDENCRIILLEKGKIISYANCGLPYHLGGVIPEKDNLLVMPAKKFAAWFNVDVRTECEVVKINREQKTVLCKTPSGEYEEGYDKLLIATGATPNEKSSIPNVFNLWTFKDMEMVLKSLSNAKKAVIVGAGFIGLEAAENLNEKGLDVTVIQRGAHVLPTIDKEMATPLAQELERRGISVRYNCTVKNYKSKDGAVEIEMDCGDKIIADVVIISTGVMPNSAIAKECGLECGPRGHIKVNKFLQTSDINIYAAGDVIELDEHSPYSFAAVPLAGPANKQGRIAANNIAGGRSSYKDSFGTSVVKVGHLTAASVGMTEAALLRDGKKFHKLYLHPASNASYYPGGNRMTLKLLFGDDGTIFGAQIVGGKGVDKRIDSIATAMRRGMRAPELGELELAYAPPYSSAKDPVNFAGFVAENILSGLSDVVYPDTIPADAVVLDVREPEENALGAIPNALNIPLGKLRERLDELDKSKLIVCCCQVGLRGYLAERILKQNGFNAANLSGGWLGWKLFFPEQNKVKPQAAKKIETPVAIGKTIDVRTLPCPGPVMKLKSEIAEAQENSVIHLLAASTFETDLLNWARNNGATIANLKHVEDYIEVDVIKNATPTGISSTLPQNHEVAMVLFSNDFDKAMAAMILANGLAASGAKVSIFFTFWGLSVLRKNPAPPVKKNFISRMFGFLLPRGASKLTLSKMNMLGMGSVIMKRVMKQKSVLTLPELMASAKEAGVKFIACDMAMDVMGITREELLEVDEVAGAATFAALAKNSNNTLFI